MARNHIVSSAQTFPELSNIYVKIFSYLIPTFFFCMYSLSSHQGRLSLTFVVSLPTPPIEFLTTLGVFRPVLTAQLQRMFALSTESQCCLSVNMQLGSSFSETPVLDFEMTPKKLDCQYQSSAGSAQDSYLSHCTLIFFYLMCTMSHMLCI